MSRIGRLPIAVPKGVDVTVIDQRTVNVKGPKGQFSQTVHPAVMAEYDANARLINIKMRSDNPKQRAFHGLSRTLVANAVEGVTKGFAKEMEIVGLGYNVKLQGKDLVLALGYTKPVQVKIPEGMTVQVIQPTNPAKFTISGVDKQLVGQIAARIRKLRPVEPYKGKGVKYKGETVRRKAGKAFGSQQQ
ncbi:MAG: 50S ribosomal protein L6 [Planctomycetes bacterium RIFCSPHIGHO2_02_FULL_50_42]|uniref:Large ribosomal subunit protein uL6 n=1 Tax=uncultured planctomycete Rifle_16ft_4_minimus_3099 TaxID=1665203 RepID=A0A0H4T6F9_9BACT|nr:50S ribosomal protein L6, large subunit ribosomal protein L6 [uncultured planctomycete Rifle_16ft_4_minimus_3099]OHB37103.1 MAG: 50S ribosomal protein L6 [Planctomycetes bacterium GWA2_50_13]OHB89889.1 MAG: 50S ribosomal protein L6 [Planctomycetes bacterium RIFCSPHIGHO2_02_FULL_50_42]OHB91402.1 MAG: 50S ribosomal protein L6 [Planctomycetes bacterium RIFCSPHIGHO2_12_FULL_51_37]OHB95516.1 MAG: 50S ribosomal protein L6 [Planctomycetes bacterium RIFCSPLOWO2_02_FULL_50_16]HCN19977.1 50S ribosoma